MTNKNSGSRIKTARIRSAELLIKKYQHDYIEKVVVVVEEKSSKNNRRRRWSYSSSRRRAQIYDITNI